MTVDEVAKEIERAMQTFKRLPSVAEDRIGRMKACWPDVLHTKLDDWWAYASVPARYNREPATAADLDRLDRVIDWLWMLTEDERVVICARGSGLSWRAIMRARRRLGRKSGSHEGHRQLWRKTVRKIAAWPDVRAA